MKQFAKEALNKTNFGMWGEFFVNTGRYATMMGRGKNRTMWGTDKFIDDVFTLNGGIAYPYYHYMRVKLFGGEVEIQWPLDDEYRDRYDGPVVLWQEEVDAADTYNPQAPSPPRAPRPATRAAPRPSVTLRVPRDPADGARREYDVALLQQPRPVADGGDGPVERRGPLQDVPRMAAVLAGHTAALRRR